MIRTLLVAASPFRAPLRAMLEGCRMIEVAPDEVPEALAGDGAERSGAEKSGSAGERPSRTEESIDVLLIAGIPLDTAAQLAQLAKQTTGASMAVKVVVLVTVAELERSERVSLLEAPVDAILNLPCEREELTSIVRSLARLRHTELTLLERARRLVDLNQRKDEFMAMLGHELRNPLSGITSAAALMRMLPEQDPRRERALAVIDRQSNALKRLVNDLLEVSRVTRGAITLRRESIDLRR